MKIIDSLQVPKRSIRTNDIPVGTVFRGTIVGAKTGRPVSGIFYKAYGPWESTHGTEHSDTVIVRLNNEYSHIGANLWLTCSDVLYYEPLDVELVIKGVLK